MTVFETDARSAARRAIARRDEFHFWTEEKLRNADTDQFIHVNNAVIATFFEAARMEIVAPPVVRTWMNGANLAVVRLLIEFSAELHFPGHVSVGSTVVDVGHTSFAVRQGLFCGTDDASRATAEAVCVLVHRDTGRPCLVTPELRAYLLTHHGDATEVFK
jgi:acyl-CoA thioester hydrolase